MVHRAGARSSYMTIMHSGMTEFLVEFVSENSESFVLTERIGGRTPVVTSLTTRYRRLPAIGSEHDVE